MRGEASVEPGFVEWLGFDGQACDDDAPRAKRGPRRGQAAGPDGRPRSLEGAAYRHGESGHARGGPGGLAPPSAAAGGASLDTKGKDAPKSRKRKHSRRVTGVEWKPALNDDGIPIRARGLAPCYPDESFPSMFAFKRALAMQFEEAGRAFEAKQGRGKQSRWFFSRGLKVRSCGNQLRGFVCGTWAPNGSSDADAIRRFIPGSGRASNLSCDLRSCPHCARRSAARESVALLRAMRNVPEARSMSWKLVTFTAWRDPSDPKAHTSKAMKQGLAAMWAGWQSVWSFLKRQKGAAAYGAIEMAEGGHIHLHAVVYSRFIVRKNAARLFAEGHNAQNGGSYRWAVAEGEMCVDVRDASPESAREVAKYITKAPSPLDEGWLAGEHRRSTLSPKLLVRWEHATKNTPLRRAYGAIRGLLAEEHERVDEAEAEDMIAEHREELPSTCPHCGSDGSCYREHTFFDLNIEQVVHELHNVGVRALRGSTWEARGVVSGPLDVTIEERARRDVVLAAETARLANRDFALLPLDVRLESTCSICGLRKGASLGCACDFGGRVRIDFDRGANAPRTPDSVPGPC